MPQRHEANTHQQEQRGKGSHPLGWRPLLLSTVDVCPLFSGRSRRLPSADASRRCGGARKAGMRECSWYSAVRSPMIRVLYIRGRLLVSSRPLRVRDFEAERLARGGIRALRARQENAAERVGDGQETHSEQMGSDSRDWPLVSASLHGASPASTHGSPAAYQPTRATARSLRSVALHSAPCSVATGRPGNGALEPRGRGDGPAWRGIGRRRRGTSTARTRMRQGRLGHADFTQRHALPATSHVQPQRRVSCGGALLVVSSARLTPAVLDLPTLHLRLLVEPATGLSWSPHNATLTALQHTQHTPMRFHRAPFC